ncbi:hypothetical protein PR001_g8137 [Phytophthora rubi]|uniref:Uncharacterized protein n=1 Tax=Phytophthora rubi TaxID=129364 RepID=A0A6A3N8H0_9STRA|nr:hypothetical protein PR001_g8137 [Phytophthora rubi]
MKACNMGLVLSTCPLRRCSSSHRCLVAAASAASAELHVCILDLHAWWPSMPRALVSVPLYSFSNFSFTSMGVTSFAFSTIGESNSNSFDKLLGSITSC